MMVDGFMMGHAPLGLLLWWGDVAGMRAGLAKVLDAHVQVLGRVHRGESSADSCAICLLAHLIT